MINPRIAEGRRCDVLAGGRIPQLHRTVLAATGQGRRTWGDICGGRGVGSVRWLPRNAVCAASVTEQFVLHFAINRAEQGDWTGSTRRGELRAVRRPRQVDHVIVQLSGPVLCQLHGLQLLSARVAATLKRETKRSPCAHAQGCEESRGVPKREELKFSECSPERELRGNVLY